MIFEFESATGRTNYGIAIERINGGVMVLLDKFQPNAKSKMPVRYRYVNLNGNPYTVNGGSRQLLPLDAHARWQDDRMRTLGKRIQSDGWDMTGAQSFVAQFADCLDRQLVYWLGGEPCQK